MTDPEFWQRRSTPTPYTLRMRTGTKTKLGPNVDDISVVQNFCLNDETGRWDSPDHGVNDLVLLGFEATAGAGIVLDPDTYLADHAKAEGLFPVFDYGSGVPETSPAPVADTTRCS